MLNLQAKRYTFRISQPARQVMSTTTVFTNNRSQAVRLPAEARFPDSVKKVQVRVVGAERVITPVAHAWDSFFLPEAQAASATDDFMADRAGQHQAERESL